MVQISKGVKMGHEHGTSGGCHMGVGRGDRRRQDVAGVEQDTAVPNHDVLQRRACLFLGAAPRRSRPICSRAPNSRAPLALRSWAPRATRQAPLPRALLAGVDLGARFARGGCSVEQSVHWCTWCSNAQVSGGCHGARPTRWHGC